MGFTELLTIVFIVLKITGVISWSWWLVCLPEILALAAYVFLLIIRIYAHYRVTKSLTYELEHFDDRW